MEEFIRKLSELAGNFPSNYNNDKNGTVMQEALGKTVDSISAVIGKFTIYHKLQKVLLA